MSGFVAAFCLTATAKRDRAPGPDDRVPRAARIVAAVSLASWTGVICCGRAIAAFRPPFHWCAWCG